MSGAFWQNPNYQQRYQSAVATPIADTSPTPEATALYAANAAAAAARAEAAATASVSIIGTDNDGNTIVKVTLPTVDPHVQGVMWDNGGFLMVSQG